MSWVVWNESASPLQWGAVLSASLAAAMFDIRSRRVPNALTLPLLVAGLAAAGLSGGPRALGDSALGCLLAAAPFLLLFLFAGGGAGDAKLMGAIGAWLGVWQGWEALLAVLIVGAVLGLCYAIASGRARTVAANLLLMGHALAAMVLGRGANSDSMRQLIPPPTQMVPMPYAVCILAGVALAATREALWRI